MKELLSKSIIPIITVIAIGVTSLILYSRISEIENNVQERINNTISSLLPKPDTSRVIVAPRLENIGRYYFFDGRTVKKSVKLLSLFEFDTTFPREIWEGYVTIARANNGARYYIWSENPITPDIDISIWTLADPHKLELDYHKNDEDKVFSQILYPLTAVKKPTVIN